MGRNTIRLTHSAHSLHGTVELTGSKSESNRALIIRAWGGDNVDVVNLSAAADTETLKHALAATAQEANGDDRTVIDVGPAGTAMRFLTAYLTTCRGRYLLTGSERMKQRPIGILVDALQKLGARIQFGGVAGFPPLAIDGGFEQATDTVTVKGNVSSQYLSALLLIAPTLPKGLVLRIEGELTSRPYLTMTLDMLREAGIRHEWQDDTIRIAPQTAQPTRLVVEPDWSAASYWYSIAALSREADLFLPNLKSHSLQGDAAIADIMKQFGVSSSFADGGVRIRKVADNAAADVGLLDFRECPDLAQTVIVCAAALRRDLSFTGLHTLKIKETDRIAALQNELGKFGVTLIEEGDVYHLRTEGFNADSDLCFDTYEDHRMAMALAPLALVFESIRINEPEVVEKSYPDYWKHLKQHGFIIS